MSSAPGIPRFANFSLHHLPFTYPSDRPENEQPAQKLETASIPKKNEIVFQICVNCFGKTITIDVTSRDTIADVKRQIEKKTKIPRDYQSLFARCLLQNASTLAEYQIDKGSTLFLGSRGVGGGFDLLIAPDFTNRRTVHFNPLIQDGIRPGLNLKGRCNTNGCSKYGEVVLVSQGFDTFALRKIIAESLLCPCCKHLLIDISIIFTDCIYTIESDKITLPIGRISNQNLDIYDGISDTYEFVRIVTVPIRSKKVIDEVKLKLEKKVARSVGCLVSRSDFEEDGLTINRRFFNSSRHTLESYLKDRFYQAEIESVLDVEFAEEPCLGGGTAFLVSRDLILTAAHNVFDFSIPNEFRHTCPTQVIFGFEKNWGNRTIQYGYKFAKENVYKINCIIAHQLTAFGGGFDWALLKLDRCVEDREPLKINFNAPIVEPASLNRPQKVWMLGYPSGRPIKWAGRATVTKLAENYFDSNLAAYVGNSGSPVFCENSVEVVGIFCRGNNNYKYDNEKKFVIKKVVNKNDFYKPGGHGGESTLLANKLTFLRTILPFFVCDPSNQYVYRSGLSIEGFCRTPQCTQNNLIVTRYLGYSRNVASAVNGFVNALNPFDCPFCNSNLDFSEHRVVVLATCLYTIEGKNPLNEIVQGTFRIHQIANEPAFFKLTVRQWHQLLIKTEEINPPHDDRRQQPKVKNQSNCLLM